MEEVSFQNPMKKLTSPIPTVRVWSQRRSSACLREVTTLSKANKGKTAALDCPALLGLLKYPFNQCRLVFLGYTTAG
ncbi:MAG TPA: hypothetical protein VFA15_10030, partial [Nitrososphaera sp.]|nr:hypothetical protein [Nitrososphaera sp.]